MTDKPFSQACENNKGPILDILREAFAKARHVLEIGSGTGQHAVHFGAGLPHLVWQTSDQVEYHDGITAWLDDVGLANVRYPIKLKIGRDIVSPDTYDGIFTANTAHIMQRDEVRLLMQTVSHVLPAGGIFCQYGPFTLNGEFSSDSNRAFHHSLIERGYGGYRDISELKAWQKSLVLLKQYEMPANNLMLVWKKTV